MQTLLRIILWSHARGTLQYDILCALILIFIFVTPRQVFHDWPVIDNPHQFKYGDQIVSTLDTEGNPVWNVSTQLVPWQGDAVTLRNAAKIQLQKTLNKPVSIANMKPIYGENGETIGYSIWLAADGSDTF
ncbi:MAG: hypothetical protein AB1898_00235 [Acidobacteriota bacterium]